MSTKSIITLVKTASIVTLAGLSFWASAPVLVQAAPMSLPGTAAVASAATGVRVITERQMLQREYAHEQRWLTGQQRAMDGENTLGGKVQTWIDALKAKGKDAAALDQAMLVFKSQMTNAQSVHNTAADILSNHAGFDANGVVTNLSAARATVRDAGQSLEGARRIRLQARADLKRAIVQWRAANRDASASPVEVAQPNPADGADQ